MQKYISQYKTHLSFICTAYPLKVTGKLEAISGKSWGTPWRGCQSTARPMHRQTSIHTHIPSLMGNLE